MQEVHSDTSESRIVSTDTKYCLEPHERWIMEESDSVIFNYGTGTNVCDSPQVGQSTDS